VARAVLSLVPVRKPRRQTLSRTGLFHKVWHGHNREPVLESPEDKRAYLDHLSNTYTETIGEHVRWFSFCLMGNHAHETGGLVRDEDRELEPGLKALGDWMRNGHSRFGQTYNRRNKRRGKVAYDRPKTTEIDSEEGVLTVMFYGDANPMRAGKVSHPSRYEHSSYRFYAHGEAGEHTAKLTPPAAYLALGSTPSARQRKYRSLCDQYLRKAGLLDDRPSEEVAEPLETEEARRACDEAPHSRGDPPVDLGEDF
jgi:putative transposase